LKAYPDVDTSNEKEIARCIELQPDTKTLKKRIIGDGGLQVRPFVKKVSVEKYVVREGNRRLTVLRQILNDIDAGKLPELIPERFEAIDCIVYPEDITEKHVALHLNNIHVNGVKEWDAWVKAGTAQIMVDELGCSEEQVKKDLNMSGTKVKEALWAYDRTTEYHQKFPDDDGWVKKFSHFQKVYSKKFFKNPPEGWILQPRNLEMFFEWVHEEEKISHAFRIAGSVGLEQVIQDKAVFEWFKQPGHGLNDAVQMYKDRKGQNDASDSIQVMLQNSAQFIHDNIHRMNRGKMKEIGGDKDKLTMFKETHQLLGEALEDIKNKK
jgi:hypothetical protein